VEPASEVAIHSVFPQMFQELSHQHIQQAKGHNAAKTMRAWRQCLRILQPSGVAPLAISQTALWPSVFAPSKAKSVVASTALSASALSRLEIPRTSTYRWAWVRPAPLKLKLSAAFLSSNPSQMSLALIFRSWSMMMMTLMQQLQLSKLNR
jgi:hypothetical protein